MTNENFENVGDVELVDDETKENVRQYLEMVLQQCYQMGNNDRERAALEEIQQEFNAGIIDADEAKSRANFILANKHDH